MNSRLVCSGLVSSLAVFGGAIGAFAASSGVNGWKDPGINTTVETAALWNDGVNWTTDACPPYGQTQEVKIAEPASGYRFIKLTSWAYPYNVQVTNWVSGTLPKVVILEDSNGALRYLCHTTEAGKADKGFWAYAPYNISASVNLSNVQLCNFIYSGAGRALYGGVTLRLDKYASNGKSVALVDRSTNGRTDYSIHGNGTFKLYAPESSATNNVSTWQLTEGSKLIRRVSALRHAIPTGAEVTGTGVESGVYVARIFPDETVELSKAATASGEIELTFGAYTANVRQTFDYVGWSGYGAFNFALNKFRPEDKIVLEINDWKPFGSYYTADTQRLMRDSELNANIYEAHGQYYFDTDEGYYPGQYVIHTFGKVVNGVTTGDYAPAFLKNCDILFSDSKLASGPGFSGPTQFVYSVENTVANLTVTGAMTAAITYMRGWRGTVNKLGTGTLNVGLNFKNIEQLASSGSYIYGQTATANASIGTLGLKEGRVNLLYTRPTSSGSNASFPKFSLSAGATLALPGIAHSERVVNTWGATLEGGSTLAFVPQLMTDTSTVGITPLKLVNKKEIDVAAAVRIALTGDLATSLDLGKEYKIVDNISNAAGSAVNWELVRGSAGPSVKARFAVHDSALWMTLEQVGMMLLFR